MPSAAGAISSIGLVRARGARALRGAAPDLVAFYQREIASDGGLYAFIERAAGRRVALVQGGIWTISYFLYLAYTVT